MLYSNATGWVETGSEIASILAGLVIIGSAARSFYRSTGGAARRSYQILDRLLPDAPIRHFENLLGTPQIEQVEAEWTVLTWIDRRWYVVAYALGGNVRAYAVTTRRRRFRPSVPGGLQRKQGWRYLPIRLGRTTFANLGEPSSAEGTMGARRSAYDEIFYYGNPGLYRHYAFGINDAGSGHHNLKLQRLLAQRGALSAIAGDVFDDEWHAARQESSPNTFLIAAPFQELTELPIPGIGHGVDLDRVRQYR